MAGVSRPMTDDVVDLPDVASVDPLEEFHVPEDVGEPEPGTEPGTERDADGLEGVGRLEPPTVDDPTRPALEKLARDQRDALGSWVSGFESRADLLLWSHEATIATLGQLSPTWHKQRLMSLAELSALIVTDDRYRWIGESKTLDRDEAREFRIALAASDLLPACEAAIRSIRWSTVERTPDEDDENAHLRVNVEAQTAPAMRPGLEETARRQRWCIDRALEGFDSVDDVVGSWVPVAMQASFGEIDPDIGAAFWREQPLRDVFIYRDDRAARFFRESFVALELLPPFNNAVAQLADRSGEAIQQGETTDHSPAEYPSA